jgi:hypothetical protein
MVVKSVSVSESKSETEQRRSTLLRSGIVSVSECEYKYSNLRLKSGEYTCSEDQVYERERSRKYTKVVEGTGYYRYLSISVFYGWEGYNSGV